MNLDWPNFTPWASLAGGMLIGLAAALFILLEGRIAGISGILGGLLKPRRGDVAWRLLFLAGLAAAPLAWSLFAPTAAMRVDAGWATLVAAGLLVGAGTRYGAGCTSGHGVCGVSRLSPRSLVATATFVLTGMLTVWLLRHAFA